MSQINSTLSQDAATASSPRPEKAQTLSKPAVKTIAILATIGLVGIASLSAGLYSFSQSAGNPSVSNNAGFVANMLQELGGYKTGAPTPTLTNPDVTSDEDPDIGEYDGVEIGIAPEGYESYEEKFMERLYSDYETPLMFRGLMPEGTEIELVTNKITFRGSDFELTMDDVGEGEVISYPNEPVSFHTDNLSDYVRYGGANGYYAYASKYIVTADTQDADGNCLYLDETFQAPCGNTSLGVGYNLGEHGDLGAFAVSCHATTEQGLAKCDFILQELAVTEL